MFDIGSQLLQKATEGSLLMIGMLAMTLTILVDATERIWWALLLNAHCKAWKSANAHRPRTNFCFHWDIITRPSRYNRRVARCTFSASCLNKFWCIDNQSAEAGRFCRKSICQWIGLFLVSKLLLIVILICRKESRFACFTREITDQSAIPVLSAISWEVTNAQYSKVR